MNRHATFTVYPAFNQDLKEACIVFLPPTAHCNSSGEMGCIESVTSPKSSGQLPLGSQT